MFPAGGMRLGFMPHKIGFNRQCSLVHMYIGLCALFYTCNSTSCMWSTFHEPGIQYIFVGLWVEHTTCDISDSDHICQVGKPHSLDCCGESFPRWNRIACDIVIQHGFHLLVVVLMEISDAIPFSLSHSKLASKTVPEFVYIFYHIHDVLSG